MLKCSIAWKFGKRLGGTATETHAKFQSVWKLKNTDVPPSELCETICRADSRFKPSQWETVLLCNNVSYWLGASLESPLIWWGVWCDIEMALFISLDNDWSCQKKKSSIKNDKSNCMYLISWNIDFLIISLMTLMASFIITPAQQSWG